MNYTGVDNKRMLKCNEVVNLMIYQAKESSLVQAGFLTAQFMQKL